MELANPLSTFGKRKTDLLELKNKFVRFNGRYKLRRADWILGTFYLDSLRTPRFQTLITSQDILVSNWNKGSLKIEEAVLWFLTQTIKK